MVSAELMNRIQNLTRVDKLYIMQVLISEFAREETDIIQPGQSYPIWSPYDAFEAANAMLKALQNTEDNDA